MPDDEHVVGHVRPSGLRGLRAVCTCGHETRPAEGTDAVAADAATELLISEHFARRDPDGVVRGLLHGASGPVRPGPPRPWTRPRAEGGPAGAPELP